MAGLGWQELAGLFVGLLIVGGSMAWGLRHSRLSMDAIRRDVAAFDAVLRALETSELRVHPGPVYEHPMVGTIPAHSTLVGTLDGYGIYVELHNSSADPEHSDYVVRIRATAPPGQAFDGSAASSVLLGWDAKSFQTEIDGRSLLVAEKPRRTATGADLRTNATHLWQHLRRVVDLARSITVAGAAVASQPPSGAAQNAFSGKRIFLLDADLGFAEALRVGLLDRGARLRVFEDSKSLIDAAGQSLPDLLVVALELPGENGWGVCHRLKKHEQTRSVPLVVVSTAFGEEEFQAHRRLNTRAQDYIVKPVSVEHVLARIALQLRGL